MTMTNDESKYFHFGESYCDVTGGNNETNCTILNILNQGLALHFTSYLGSTSTSVAHCEPLKFIKEIA